MELSYDSQEELIASVCEEAIQRFRQLERTRFIVALRLPVNDLASSILRSIRMPYYPDSIYSRGLIVKPANITEPLIEILHVESEITLKSHGFNYDDPTLWISSKLQKHLKTNVILRDPSKMETRNQPITQSSAPIKEKEIIREKEVIIKIRCPYCKNLYPETLDKCPHCGARA